MRDKPVPRVLIGHPLQCRDDCNGEEQPSDDISRLPGRDQRSDGSEADGDDDVFEVEVGDRMNVRPVRNEEHDGEHDWNHRDERERDSSCGGRRPSRPVHLRHPTARMLTESRVLHRSTVCSDKPGRQSASTTSGQGQAPRLTRAVRGGREPGLR